MATGGRGRPRFESDPALIRACLAGDEGAWHDLVDRYGRLVYSIARGYGLSADDADDVFQGVFVILNRQLGALRDQTRLSSWLITTTHRECWRLRRRDRDREPLDEAVAAEGPPPVEEIIRREREQGVREALARLDGRCRELLTALFLDPSLPSYEAIGARLGMPIGSIGPTRARCFRKLEAILLELGIDPEG
jgi:RNA polymerase sigma factor (sigma-70 family)